MTKKLGYIRLSRDDSSSMSVENQKKALKEYDPKILLFTDTGVSGESNLVNPKSAWFSKLLPQLAKTPDAQVVVYSLDRLGRKKGKVLSAIEDLIDGGGTLYVVRDKKLYDDPEDFEQAISLTFASLSNEAYRVEVKKKTQRALDVLKEAGVTLGRKPALTEKDVRDIHDLHSRGLGYTAIGKVVRTKRKGGELVNVSPRVVRAVITGTYMSREEWERRNQIARLSMIGGSGANA